MTTIAQDREFIAEAADRLEELETITADIQGAVMREPETEDELIVAEESATRALYMAAAAQYGIMPTQAIDVARCETIIRKAQKGRLYPDQQRVFDDLKRGRIEGA